MKALIVLILFPCLLFAQLMPKYFSNTHNFTSVSSTINNKFNETSTDKAIDDFQKTDIDKIEASYPPNDSIVKTKYEKKVYVDSSKIIYSWGEGLTIDYCLGKKDYENERYSLGPKGVLDILEKDIKDRNMPNKYYASAKRFYNFQRVLLWTSLAAFLGGIIMDANGMNAGKYIGGVGILTVPVNIYGLGLWGAYLLDDAINEYNKNLAY